MSTILITIVVVVFAQVVSRYLLYRSLSWSEELARYLLLWLAMLSAAYGVKTGSHFALVLVVNRFRPGLRNSVNLLVTLAIAAFLVLFVINGAQMTYSGLGRVGPGTRLPLAVPYASTVVGGTFMLYYVLRNGWNDLKHLLPWGARSEEEAG